MQKIRSAKEKIRTKTKKTAELLLRKTTLVLLVMR